MRENDLSVDLAAGDRKSSKLWAARKRSGGRYGSADARDVKQFRCQRLQPGAAT